MRIANKRRIFIIALLVMLSLGAVSAVNYTHIDGDTSTYPQPQRKVGRCIGSFPIFI